MTVKSSGQSGVSVKFGAFSEWGRAGRGSLENFRGRGGAGRASLVVSLRQLFK